MPLDQLAYRSPLPVKASAITISIGLAIVLQSLATQGATLSNETKQCILVLTESWSSPHGIVRWFDRTKNSDWQPVGKAVPVLVGRAGLAWGRGEFQTDGLAGPIKSEGDDKAPAGVFRLGTAFGYSERPPHTRMPYLHLLTTTVAVDDPESRYYNRLVDATQIKDRDWRSSENMILSDQRYKWGIVVLHNLPPHPGAGSCIFLHVWKDPSTATSGCTAMAESDLIRLLGWLDPAKTPLLVQLPRSIYSEVAQKWGLPPL